MARLEFGTVIEDRFEIIDILGEGGMGVVYRANDRILDRPVALKVLSASSLGSEGKVRLLHEAKAVAKLSHANIVLVFDAGEIEGTAYIVMELVEGVSLRDHVTASVSETLNIVLQVCQALDHAHQKGIIHRDLKPENIILGKEGTVKLVDFGLALERERVRITEEGALVGTFSYIAPELIYGQEPSPRSDLYSLGVVLYEMVAGRAPFSGENLIAVISQHVHAPVVPPSKYNPEIPRELDQLITSLLSKDLDDRQESALEVAEQIEAILGKVGSEKSPAVPAAQIPDKSSDRNLRLQRIVRGRMIGREEEINQLRSYWDQAANGEGHLVLLSGEPGIGKTRLSKELAVYARLRQGEVINGGYHPELSAPYIGFWEALKELIFSYPREEAQELIGTRGTELIKIVPEVGQVLEDINPSETMGDVEAEQVRLFNQVIDFLRLAAAKKPLLIILEDLHWADKPSLQLLYSLVRNIPSAPIMILGTYRESDLEVTEPFYETLLGLNREHLYTRIVLDRLTEEKVNGLLESILDGAVDPKIAAHILQETKGNPFFVEEIIKALVDQSAISEQDGIWRSRKGVALEVPQSVQLAVGGRLSRLHTRTRELLTSAAILGREFDVDVLLAMLDWSEDELLDALEEAQRAQLIAEVREHKGYLYAFEHALFVQVIYDAVSARRRSRYHLEIAEAIERVHAREVDQYTDSLAHHYALAGSRAAEQAAKYNLLAAHNALSVYAHEQAIRYFETAIEALEDVQDDQQLAQAWIILGDTYYDIHLIDNAFEAYQHAYQLIKDHPENELANYTGLLGKLGFLTSNVERDLETAVALLEKAIALTPVQAHADIATFRSYLAKIIADQGELETAVSEAKMALHIAEQSEDKKALAYAYEALCVIHRLEDDLPAFLETSRKQAESLEGTEDHHSQFMAYWNAASASWIRGRYKEGEQFALAGQEISKKLNVPGWESLTLAAYTLMLAEQGRWDEAIASSERVLPLFQQMGSNNCFCYIFAGLAQIEARRGMSQNAMNFISNAQNIWEMLDDPTAVIRWQFFAHYYLREWEQAWEIAENLKEMGASVLGVTAPSMYHYSTMLPEVAARVGHLDEAISLAEEAIRIAQHPEVPTLSASAHFALGIAYAAAGQKEQALQELTRAGELHEGLGRKWDIANTQYEIGVLKAGPGNGAGKAEIRNHLDSALVLFTELKAEPGMNRVQDALSRLEA